MRTRLTSLTLAALLTLAAGAVPALATPGQGTPNGPTAQALGESGSGSRRVRVGPRGGEWVGRVWWVGLGEG